MKQFVIGGMNLLEKFLEWIGEKVKDVKKGSMYCTCYLKIVMSYLILSL